MENTFCISMVGSDRPGSSIDGRMSGVQFSSLEDQAKVYATGKLKIAAGKHRITLAFANGGTKEDYDRKPPRQKQRQRRQHSRRRSRRSA